MAYPEELMRLSVEEYLALEEKSEVRHEYVAGYIFAMAGATDAHNVITMNVAARFRPHISRSGCRVYTELTDRREKLSAYFKLESLIEYVLISQDEKRVEIYRRGKRGKTEILVLRANDEVRFESLPNGALTLTMDDIYEDIIFAQPSRPPEDE